MRNLNSKFLVLFMSILTAFTLYCDIGSNVNTKVVMVGDSIFALSDEIAAVLETLSGEEYRYYYISGAEMITPLLPIKTIPEQYTQAKSDDPDIRTVIMDGGGNDVLIGNQSKCSGEVITEECKELLAPVFSAAREMMLEMKADGVQNLIYLGYYNVLPEGWLVADSGLEGVLDYAAQQTAAILAEFGPGGHYIDTRAAFEGHPEYIAGIFNDGVHPSDEGSAVLAHLIWDVMVANNIEQH